MGYDDSIARQLSDCAKCTKQIGLDSLDLILVHVEKVDLQEWLATSIVFTKFLT